MSYQTPVQKREGLRQYLLLATGNCNIQEGADGKDWPCGTCVLWLFNSIGLDATKPEYHDKNDEHDRHNEVWRAILQIRDAKLETVP